MATQEQKIVFRKIEDVLYSYKKYVDKIKYDLKELENPQITKSYSIGKLTGSGYVTVKSEVERIEELKERLLNDIARHEEMLFRIDNALKMVEDHKDYSFIDLLFETVSAFATVGLSKDLTPHLKDITKVFIIILMFIGRVGPLTIIFSFYNKVNRKKFKYSNGNVIIG